MIFIITICLDGMKFLPIQLATFNRIKTPWRWVVVEGQAKASGCTSWCGDMSARLSIDGSHEWLKEVASHHPNVIHSYDVLWEGKLAMFNRATSIISEIAASHSEPAHVVMECDADELWRPEQIDRIYDTFEHNPSFHWMKFWCRYFMGPNIVVSNRGHYGNHSEYEWIRAWRWFHGFRFTRHEAPQTNHPVGVLGFDNDQTERMGMVFDHQAYFYESQVRYKEKFYKYTGAVEQWRALQANTKWPCKVRDFLSWVKDDATADLICKP